MTMQQFASAISLAASKENIEDDISIFDGFGLPDFKPVVCSVRQVARLIRWQCLQFNGKFDWAELNFMQRIAQYKFAIVA